MAKDSKNDSHLIIGKTLKMGREKNAVLGKGQQRTKRHSYKVR